MSVVTSVHSIIYGNDGDTITITPSGVRENHIVFTVSEQLSNKSIETTISIDDLREAISFITVKNADIVAKHYKKQTEARKNATRTDAESRDA